MSIGTIRPGVTADTHTPCTREMARLQKELAESKTYIEALRVTARILLDELPETWGSDSNRAARERALRVLAGALS